MFVSAGAGTGQDVGARRALRPRGLRPRHRRRLDPRHHVHAERRQASCGRASAALRERGRPDLARELDSAWISTIHGFCNRLLRAHPFAAGLDPRFRELEDAGAAVLRGEAFERALEAFCAGGDPSGSDCSRRTAPTAAPHAHGRLRDAALGRSRARPRARRAPERRDAVTALRAEADSLAADRRRPRPSAGTRARRYASRPRSPPEKLVDLSAFRAARRAGRVVRVGAQAARSEPRSRSSPRTIATSCRSCSSGSPPSTRPRSDASRPSTSRTSSSRRATSFATTPSVREATPAALPDGHGRRVPGHEPAPVRAHRPRRAPRAHRGLHGR